MTPFKFHSITALVRVTSVALAFVCANVFYISGAGAEGRFSGAWIASKTPNGPPIISLDLFDNGKKVSGSGSVANAGLGPFDGSTFSIVDGVSNQTGIQLRMQLRSTTSNGVSARALLAVSDGNGPALPGTLIWGQRTAQIFLRRGENSAALGTNNQTADRRPRACRELDQVNARVSRKAGGGTEIVQEIRGVYTLAGLAFGGLETATKCKDAMVRLATIEKRLDGQRSSNNSNAALNSPQCQAMASTTEAIGQELRRIGMTETGTIAVIMQKYGLPGGGAAGRYTPQGCRAAYDELQAYLGELRQTATFGSNQNTMQPSQQQSFQYNPVEFVSGRGWVPGNGGTRLSYWLHNKSGMAWESGPGNQRFIWYWNPRPGLSNVGVENKVLLFRGEKRGKTMSGEARVFTRACGTFPYQVSGPIAASNLKVTMRGRKPIVNDSCEIVGTKADTLVFTYQSDFPPNLEQTSPTNVTVEPDENDMPGIGVWGPAYKLHRLPSGETLNVRAGPGTNNAVISELPFGARDVLIIGQGCSPNPDTATFETLSKRGKARAISKSWCNINWRNIEGWVYGKYLTPQ
ncbi:SH3 domain-containing protein [Pseudahrensia aquimaris]|uniref:SH3 domain-containing protein n=1 Tax=Pseudahrensia aquimaris TaxID=744461 RepID=A0ABW3FFP3_9HYPH